ncbi:MAG TPA: Crp/Fnr family transcriptional regulator [Panacibacter sp.]|nr:Crp/Fnr family transcriptional regulator [Panacibacter sp.]HNP45072.1 Crp/Fnr family transcriptional regulator [Panacibacter sp.]
MSHAAQEATIVVSAASPAHRAQRSCYYYSGHFSPSAAFPIFTAHCITPHHSGRQMKEELKEASIEPLLQYFDKLIPLDKAERNLVRERFHSRLFRKRQYVLQEGNVCTQFCFVVRGCLRMYRIDEKGNTHILQFAAENWWMIDLGSFHSLKPSALNIDAIEDTMVLQISRDDLISLYTAAPKFNLIFRVLIENSFVKLQERLLQTISSTAEDRYQSFLERYAHLNNRLSQTQIAAYLGITAEFLSRLRNRLSKAGKAKS